VKKYLFTLSSFLFGVVLFFAISIQHNAAFAAGKPIPAGQKCYQSQGCGTTAEICVPDGKMCNASGILSQSCGTGTCTLTTATSGSCTPGASDCDAAKGYTCVKNANNPANCGIMSGLTQNPACTYSCQSQSKNTQSCQGTAGTQGSCGNGLVCNYKTTSGCSIQGVFNTTEPACSLTCQKQAQTSQTCTGTAGTQGTCGSGLVCNYKSGDASNCGTAGAIMQPGAVCTQTCQKQAQTNQTCTGTAGTQGTCGSGLVCNYKSGDTSNCGTAGAIMQPGAVCTETCQNPQSPTTSPAPSLPPPPSPPCTKWNKGECISFSSGIGAFSTDPESFVQSIFDILLSASGGLALLLIIRAGYQLMTSQGKPEQIQQGRDQLVAAIVGLLFLIFSFVALQLIGVDILHLPGFTP